MVARARRVVWSESAKVALDEALSSLAEDSIDGAVRVLTRALDAAGSLSTLAERGHIVPEIGDRRLRELFVFDYRLLYRVYDDRGVMRAFLHGARDFPKWRREQVEEP